MAIQLEVKEKDCPYCGKHLSRHAQTALRHVNSMCLKRVPLTKDIAYESLPDHKEAV